ncbi:MAG: FAD-dependent monooxygenase [Solirubrobacteraceae bacterium]
MRVVIVGGGVAGLTAALALARKGIDAHVYEQAPAIEPIGASLSIGPNALRLIDELGLLEPLRAVGVRPDAVDFLRWDSGERLLRTPVGEPAEAHFGAPQLDFLRPDLHRVLLDALPEEGLTLGLAVTGIEQDEHRVTLRLADGGVVDADLAVAADGVRSPMRALLAGADAPEFSGTVVWRGVAAVEDVEALHPDRVNRYWLGPGCHGVSYWVAGGRLLAVNCAVRQAEWSHESWTLEADATEPLAHFAGWDESLLQRIRACPILLRGAVYVRRPLKQWSYGRITLIGDAAHAMEPFQAQGAAQAIEDAYVLAECLAAQASDPVSALLRYERIRMCRAQELQSSSHAAAESFYLPDGDQQRERDASYETLTQTLPWGPRQRIWEHDVRDELRAAKPLA